MASAGVGLGRLDQVGAPVGDALEHGPHDLGPAGAPGEAEQRAPGAVVPRGVPRPSSAGTNTTPPVSAHAPATVVALGATSMIPRSSRSHSTLVPPTA